MCVSLYRSGYIEVTLEKMHRRKSGAVPLFEHIVAAVEVGPKKTDFITEKH